MNQRDYFTETRQNVTQRIETGLTEFFSIQLRDALMKAEALAKLRRSYTYPVFNFDNEHIGFGVPK